MAALSMGGHAARLPLVPTLAIAIASLDIGMLRRLVVALEAGEGARSQTALCLHLHLCPRLRQEGPFLGGEGEVDGAFIRHLPPSQVQFRVASPLPSEFPGLGI